MCFMFQTRPFWRCMRVPTSKLENRFEFFFGERNLEINDYENAKNLLMNMYQRQTVEYVYNEYLMKSSVDRDSQTEENIDLRFLNEYIDSLAEELPAQRKKIFILSKRQNYTNKEIAEIMGISESTVATQLSLAVKFMREQLMKHYDKVITLLLAFFVNEM